MATISITHAFLFLVLAQGDALRVLGPDPSPRQMMTAYLNRLADKALEERAASRESLKDPQAIAAYQEEMRRFFRDQLGEFPERTPLNPRVVEVQMREGYRFEKVIYESRPGFFVTAVLFLPLTPPPYPAVLVPCGHSDNGKVNEVYQRACMSLARNGIAALIYDPIGQGERYQILDEKGRPRFGPTTEHMLVGVGCILLGINTATYRIWDGMRGLDYLASRPDIDPERIGCTGNSGGGTLTSYLMALDPRIQCAAPGCYLTSFQRLLEREGPQDAEQNIYGQVAHGMDHADYLMMRAPKPTLVLAATRDFFDIRGAWDSFREAKRLYAKLGFPERVDLVEANEEHGFTRPLRQGMVRWMRRWLCGIDDAVTEAEFPVLSAEEMRCAPKGQVLLMEGARSVFDINAEREKELAAQRRKHWKTMPKEKALEQVRAITGIRPLSELPEPQIETVGTVEGDGYCIEKVIVCREPGIPLPALVFCPARPKEAAFLYVNGEGKATDAGAGGPLEQLVRKGHLVCAPDLRGMGETASMSENKAWNEQFGGGWKDFFRAYLLGKSYLGMRAEDILVCARFLSTYHGPGRPRSVHLVAVGEAGPAALHAAALEPDCFASVRLERSIRCWSEVVRAPLARQQLLNAVHGALRAYDLPDLLATLPKRKVTVIQVLRLAHAAEGHE